MFVLTHLLGKYPAHNWNLQTQRTTRDVYHGFAYPLGLSQNGCVHFIFFFLVGRKEGKRLVTLMMMFNSVLWSAVVYAHGSVLFLEWSLYMIGVHGVSLPLKTKNCWPHEYAWMKTGMSHLHLQHIMIRWSTDQMDPGVSVPKKRLYKMSPVSKINSLQNDSWKNKG